MLKASAGGGGKGIRKVNTEEELAPAFDLRHKKLKQPLVMGRCNI